jgi:hypothetical protein
VSRTQQRHETRREDYEQEHALPGAELLEGMDQRGTADPELRSTMAQAQESRVAAENETRARRERRRQERAGAPGAGPGGVGGGGGGSSARVSFSASAGAAGGRKGGGSSSAAAAAAALPLSAAAGRDFVPIIMVPPGLGAIINSRNVADFLGQQRYVPVNSDTAPVQRSFDRKVTRSGGVAATQRVQIEHDPKQLSREDWSRVVAVIVLGKKWQFKSWPQPNEVVDILSRVLGVHVRFDDASVEQTIQQWNVKRLTINRTQRHLDPVAVRKFWGFFDEAYKRKRAEMV